MIIIRVELWSAITGNRQELARMVIDNVAINETGSIGDYRVRTLRGRSESALDRAMTRALRGEPGTVQRDGEVRGHPRLREHVWNLVAKALGATGYGK